MHNLASWRQLAIALTLAVLVSPPARAGESDFSEPEHLDDLYRKVALPPYLERRVQAILQAEWQEAQENAVKVGLRRMSRSRYRRALVALDRRTDAQIRALIGPKKFLLWNRARLDPMRAGSPSVPRVGSARDRCAGLVRLLRGRTLENTTAEEAHFWIHDHARHC